METAVTGRDAAPDGPCNPDFSPVATGLGFVSADGSPQMIQSWDFKPTVQGTFFRDERRPRGGTCPLGGQSPAGIPSQRETV